MKTTSTMMKQRRQFAAAAAGRILVSLLLLLAAAPSSLVSSFVVRPNSIRAPSSRLFLEDWVADLIDQELFRQGHKKEFENEWMEKNRNAVLSRIETDFVNLNDMGGGGDDDTQDFRMHQKDKRLAFKDPERYCADRCVATGNCDIFEDFYEMSPEQVIAFCTECVLSEDENGECEIPEGFYDKPRP